MTPEVPLKCDLKFKTYNQIEKERKVKYESKLQGVLYKTEFILLNPNELSRENLVYFIKLKRLPVAVCV